VRRTREELFHLADRVAGAYGVISAARVA
jgi:hypothetical protein